MYSRDILLCGDGRICPISVLARERGLRVWELSSSPTVDLVRLKTDVTLSLPLDTGVAVCVGVVDSCGEPLRTCKGLEPSRLARRASNRLITLELALVSGSSLAFRRSLGLGRAASVKVVSRLSCRGLKFSLSGISSVRDMQSSVRFRHMLSAFRRNCRSIALAGPTTDAAVGELPKEPALPVRAAKFKASDAAASKDRNTLGFITDFALASAEWRSGCILVVLGFLIVEASGELCSAFLRFGDDDILVMVVVAVCGRSFRTPDMAALEDLGSIPVSSSLRSRDFKLSNSSQTVDGAVVDTVDSVPAA